MQMIENVFNIPNIDLVSRGINLYSNPDILNRRCSSSHIRHFDQSESFDSFDRRPTSSRSLSHGLHNCFDDSPRSCGPVALPNGTIQVRLRHGIRVYFTLDKSVRVTNSRHHISLSLSSNGCSAAMIHPNGKVYQYGSLVEIVAYDGNETNDYVRYAKMWHKGISFTRNNCALVYLIDPAGTRTTSDSFSNMRSDHTVPVFLNDSRHGPMYAKDIISVLQKSTYWCSTDGAEEFHINDFRIIQTADGLVKVMRPSHQWLIKTSSRNSSATLTTPQIHCTASLNQNSHLFVRRLEKRMHFDGSNFVVRNESQSAGFDENDLLNVY
ncbi:hypothetical protein HA402_000554 [Bradysia odoriphaga]|nr:hypothetical protein HA402_000554 [Bradysia odoriphaga]